jgi:hypothetical protein
MILVVIMIKWHFVKAFMVLAIGIGLIKQMADP